MKQIFVIIVVLCLAFLVVQHVVTLRPEVETNVSTDKATEASSKEDGSHAVQLTETGSQALGIVTRPLTGITIPASALIWFNGKPYVYMETETLHFRRQEVTIKSFNNDSYEVDGLPTQGSMVIQGVQMLLSEEQRGSVEGAAE